MRHFALALAAAALVCAAPALAHPPNRDGLFTASAAAYSTNTNLAGRRDVAAILRLDRTAFAAADPVPPIDPRCIIMLCDPPIFDPGPDPLPFPAPEPEPLPEPDPG